MNSNLLLRGRTTATKEVLASSDVRVLVANHLGVSVDRVADTAHFSHDLGADWLDRLDLVMVIEDQFPGLQISDDEVDRWNSWAIRFGLLKPWTMKGDDAALLQWSAICSVRA